MSFAGMVQLTLTLCGSCGSGKRMLTVISSILSVICSRAREMQASSLLVVTRYAVPFKVISRFIV